MLCQGYLKKRKKKEHNTHQNYTRNHPTVHPRLWYINHDIVDEKTQQFFYFSYNKLIYICKDEER